MRTMCIEICFEWLSSMDQATNLEFVVEMLQLRRLLDKTVAAQRHRATAKRLKQQGFLLAEGTTLVVFRTGNSKS